MKEVERYIREVLRSIQSTPQEKARIEADLRSHFQEAQANGEPVSEIVRRMGSPMQVAEEFMAGVVLHYAGFWSRLLAFAIDLAVMVALVLLMAGTSIPISNMVPQGTSLLPPSTEGWTYVVGAVLIIVVISLWLGAVGVFLLYFPILEGRFGQTAGKRLLGLRVVRENGLSIGYKEAFLRRLSYYFDFLPIDALFIFFTAKRQRAFDIIARTVVIH